MDNKQKRPFRNRAIPNRFYTNQAEWERIGKKAKQAGMSRSTFIRYCTERAEVKPRLSPEEMEVYKRLIRLEETLHYLAQLAGSAGVSAVQGRLAGNIERLEFWIRKLHNDW